MVTDQAGAARWVLRGTWDEQMEAAKVISTKEHGSKPVFETGDYKIVWKRRYPPLVLQLDFKYLMHDAAKIKKIF